VSTAFVNYSGDSRMRVIPLDLIKYMHKYFAIGLVSDENPQHSNGVWVERMNPEGNYGSSEH
jgi:hypothetical protein